MDINSENLIYLFKNIEKKDWIEGSKKGWGDIGLTFEKEIGKSPDSKYTPDYKNIEIKCSTKYSRYPLYLFTISFDGPSINETARITNKYGYYDKEYTSKKILYKKIQNYISDDNKYNFKFEINREEERIYLSIYDSNYTLVEKKAYITFSNIKEHLYTKLNKLAIVKAQMKKINAQKYYHYYNMCLYELKSFNTFLSLIEENMLEIWFVSGIRRSGDRQGEQRNNNLAFSIKKENIDKLFTCYYNSKNDNS